MVKIGAPGIVSLVIAAFGVLLFLLAVTGVLFEEPTRITDVGLWSVTVVFLAIGLLGFWASVAERREQDEKRSLR